MKPAKRQKGQTVIETALIIVLILMIFFGIAEIARAWWLKGQLNNAARVGVRVAAVTSPITLSTNVSCGSPDVIVTAACDSISNSSLKSTVHVTVQNLGTGGTTPATGDPISVTVTGTFTTIVPGLSSIGMGGPGGWSKSLYKNTVLLSGQSVMRHE